MTNRLQKRKFVAAARAQQVVLYFFSAHLFNIHEIAHLLQMLDIPDGKQSCKRIGWKSVLLDRIRNGHINSM